MTQSVEYARACAALGQPVERHDLCLGKHHISWQSNLRSFPLLGKIRFISRGPALPNPELWPQWAEVMRCRGDAPLILNAQDVAETDLRQAGFWPLVTPTTLACLRLDSPAAMRAAMHQKWRNRLHRAERSAITATRLAYHEDHWIFAADTAQARTRRYRRLPVAFSHAWAQKNPENTLIIEARGPGQTAPLAAALILMHGQTATWHIGHSTQEGRSQNAMNVVLWAAMQRLAEQGFGWFDLGTLNTEDAPGIARFKLGSGAAAMPLSGSWFWQKSLAPLARRLPGFLRMP